MFQIMILMLLSTGGNGQLCQQSLPSQYDPISDPSTTTSFPDTFHLYPEFFSTTQCTGSITEIQYQFCYMYTRTIGEPVTVFTVLILSDEGSVYRIIDSYTEREDRNLCNSTSNTCCKTVTRAVSLTVESDLAIGFVTADSFGNALYQSDTAFSPGFVVSGSIVPSTDINRAINSTGFSGVRPRISNRRFSVNFTTDSSIMATTSAISSVDTRTSTIDVTMGSQRQLEWACSSSTRNGVTYFPNVPIDKDSLADSIRDSPYLSSTYYIYPFQPPINDNCNGKTLVEFCFTNTEDVKKVAIIILLGRLATDTVGPSSTSISGTVLERISIDTTVKCSSDFTNNVCCHSERINTILPAQMNAFGVFLPEQTLLEYNDSQYQAQTFVVGDINFIGVTSDDNVMFEASGFTTNLNLRFLRFVISGEVTTQPPPASGSRRETYLAVGIVVSLIFVIAILIAGILSVVTVVQCVSHRRLKQNQEREEMIISINQLATSQEDLSNHYDCSYAEIAERSCHHYNEVQQPRELAHAASTNDPSGTYNLVTMTNEAYSTNIVTEDNAAYTKPTINQHLTLSTDSATHGDFNSNIDSTATHIKEEEAYVVPGCDEHSLSKQFSKFKIQNLHKDAVSTTKLLGAGQFGAVHKGEWVASEGGEKIEVAVKTLKEGAGEGDKVKFLQEAAIMGQFSHPNVVKLYGVVTEGISIMLILELLLQDLRHVLRESNSMDADLPHTLLSYCRQIASGMSYLSSKLFIHRDLAARNILVSKDGACKIADFGMARDLSDTEYYISHGGKIPVKWTAPEALHYQKYSTASDVWSFGCVMYEIWSLGHTPFEMHTNIESIKLVVDKGIRLAPPPGCPRFVYKLMMDYWHPDPSSRPDFVSVLQQLSLPDTKLLKWSEEDKATDPEAATLGAGLDKAMDLYMDLQKQYNMPSV